MKSRFLFKTSLFSGVGLTIGTTVYYRPIPMKNSSDKRTSYGFASTSSLADEYAEKSPFFYRLGQRVLISTLYSICRFFMNTCGECNIVKDENYFNFIRCLILRDADSISDKIMSRTQNCHRNDNRALITVSNHRSLLDDPGMVTDLLNSIINILYMDFLCLTYF